MPITINGRPFAARKGELVIAAAERAGEYIPRFCYHNRMSSVGMCRMCLVEVDSGRGPQLTPTCMVTVAPDMKVDTESATTKRAQEGILELLLANHPLDCPVCDKGGECPLQDQAFSHGPGESRYVEEKRHFEKPIPISDLVLLDRERCILCDRCTRFADEVAGDPLISFTQRGNQTQVMTFPDEPFASYFSGNTVQICPVGALTATPYRFKARPWDLEQVESTCTTCCGRLPHRRPVAAATSSCATSASTPTRSTGAGCATAAASTSRRRTSDDRARARRSSAARAGSPRRRGASPWTPPPSSSARRSTPAARAASPCSAAPAARTRTPTPGPRSPTPSASRTATPSSATGCRPSVLGAAAGDDRRGRRGGDDRAARRPT